MENPFETITQKLSNIERLLSNFDKVPPEKPKKNEEDPDLVDINEAATITKYERSYIYELKQKKKIPFIQRGKGEAIRFSKRDLIAWMESGQPNVFKEVVKNLRTVG